MVPRPLLSDTNTEVSTPPPDPLRRLLAGCGNIALLVASKADRFDSVGSISGRSDMARFPIFTAAFGFALGVLIATPVDAWDRGDVDVLTVLPDATPGHPSSVEGLTVGPDGNIYAATFGFNYHGRADGQCRALRHQAEWHARASGTIQDRAPTCSDLRFNPVNGSCWSLISALARSSTSTRQPGCRRLHTPTIADSGLNALTFDKWATPTSPIRSTA